MQNKIIDTSAQDVTRKARELPPIDRSTPAFPTYERINGEIDLSCVGMTLRDYFAAKFMARYIADENYHASTHAELAEMSYIAADELMKARSKGE